MVALTDRVQDSKEFLDFTKQYMLAGGGRKCKADSMTRRGQERLNTFPPGQRYASMYSSCV